MPLSPEEMARLSEIGQKYNISPEAPAAAAPQNFADQVNSEDLLAIRGLRENLTLPATGDTRPDYADGLTLDRPITDRGVVEFSDRLKMAVGNKKGQLELMKSKFDDAFINGSGDLLVKKQGLWYNADPKTDPWKFTNNLLKAQGKLGTEAKLTDEEKESVADLAEAGPAIAAGGASVAAAYASGGASIPIQAAIQGAVGATTKTIETSLGRAVGTYEATPEEQLRDIGTEALFNVGSVLIPAGVKPTAKWVGSVLPDWSRAMAGASAGVKETTAGVLARMAGKETDDVLLAMEKGDAVAAVINQLDTGTAESTIGNIQRSMVSDVKNMAKSAQPGLNSFWKRGQASLEKLVGNNFVADTAPLINGVKGDALENGFLKLVKGNVEVTGAEAKTLLLNGEAKGYKVVVNSFEDAQKFLNSQGTPVKLLPEDYKDLAGFLGNLTRQEAQLTQLKGKAGFKQIMEFKQALAEQTWDLAQRNTETSKVLANKFSQYGSMLNSGLQDSLAAHNPALAKGFQELSTKYGAIKSQLAPLAKALSSSKGPAGEAAFETYVNQLMSKGGKNEVKKEAFEKAIALFKENGMPSRARYYQSMLDTLQVKKAAKAFTPRISTGLASTLASGGAAGAALSGNPVAALGLAATTALSSPRAQLGALRLLNKTGFKVLDTFKKLGPKGMRELTADPNLFNATIKTWLDSPNVAAGIQQGLMQSAERTIAPIIGGGDGGQ